MFVPPEERFTETADHYRRARPGYPAALVARIAAETGLAPGAAVVDLGAGTGIATRLFARAGYVVTGVEPNDAMRAESPALVKGEASATGLPARAFDLAIAAQAFHWFPIPETLHELSRILRPPGSCAAFWNLRRKDVALMDEYETLIRSLSTEYEQVPKPLPTIAAIKARPEVHNVREYELPNEQVLSREDLVARALSSSYVTHGVKDLPAFERALGALFDRHQRDGSVTFAYRTVCVVWRLA